MESHSKGIRAIAFDNAQGAAWISQLHELKEILSRIGVDLGLEQDVLAMRPHEFFDIFAGTGIGGIFVVLFTRLRMTLGEVLRFCQILHERLFFSISWMTQDTAECKRIFEAILLEQLGDFSLDDSLDVKDSPKGFVCVINLEYPSQPRFLRTYKVRSNFGPGCTIRQALQTTLADGLHLPSVPIQQPTTLFMAGSINFSNPTLLLMKELVAAFPAAEHAACITNLGAGYAGSRPLLGGGTVDQFRTLVQDCEAVAEHVRELSRDLESFFVRISVNHLPQDLPQDDGIFGRIISTTEAHLCTAAASAQVDDVVDAIIKRPAIVALTRLVSLAGVDGKGQLHSTVDQIASLASWTHLRKILEPNISIHNVAQEHTPCLPNTSHTILNTVRSWIQDPQADNIRLLLALPGAGKSTVATSLAHELATAGLLGAKFFCRRSEAAAHTPRSVWRLVALDLCKHTSFATALAAQFKEATPDLDSLPINELFEKVIAQPLKAVESDKVIVIIIDALDEFGDQTADSLAHRDDFLDTISSWKNFPSHCRLFITGRTGTGIEKILKLGDASLFTLQVGTPESLHDIEHYYHKCLSRISMHHLHFPENWPTDADISLLVKQAAGLFIWASTLVKVVVSLAHDPPALKKFLAQLRSGTVSLNALYQMILETAFPEGRSTYLLTSVIGAVFYGIFPFSQTALCLLFGFDKVQVANICAMLQPVMDSTTNLTFIHQSFVDFIQSTACPNRFRFRASTRVDMLERCFATINSSQLHFNMGKLQSSLYISNDVPALCDSVPEHVRYSCLAWAAHLTSAEDSAVQAMLGEILAFLQEKLLFWLEVMCIEGDIGEAARSLTTLILHSEVRKTTNILMETIRDALAFIRTLVAPIASRYPHIYISALPFTPTTSHVRQNYCPRFQNIMKVELPLESWSPEQGRFLGHQGPVRAVTFSPDGRLVASGSKDRTVRLWNAETGDSIRQPLLGHEGTVTSLVFSHDGRLLASGSSDKTTRRWDALSGEALNPPLRRATDRIGSVAISSDGRDLVASSVDGKVWRWDAETGREKAKPLSRIQGFFSRITTIEKHWATALSNDTRRVVSAAASTKFHVWDGNTGRSIASTDSLLSPIYAVAFSPDGRRFASASGIAPATEIIAKQTLQIQGVALKLFSSPATLSLDDVKTYYEGLVKAGLTAPSFISSYIPLMPRFEAPMTRAEGSNQVCLWDAETGAAIGEHLHGHEGPVTSVAFSFDGKRLASGSTDGTIRIWDATTGVTVSKLLLGHNEDIRSVAFSPDGQRLVSGSEDGSIRFWDAQAGGADRFSFNERILSVIFSSDGRHVTSGSTNSVVHDWDAETGISKALPLEGTPLTYFFLIGFQKTIPTKPLLSPDGQRYLLGASNRAIFWDLGTYEFIMGNSNSLWARSVAFSSDSRRIAAGYENGIVRYFDGKTGDFISEINSGHTAPVDSVAFSVDGSIVASGSRDGAVRLWEADSGAPIGAPISGHIGAVLALSFSHDGLRLASGSEDKTIRLWDVETGAPVGDPLCGHTDVVSSLAFSPNCHLLASGSLDKSVRLWDGALGKPMGGPLLAHKDRITCLAFSPDGSRLASGSWDKRVRIWDTSQVKLCNNDPGTLRDDVVSRVLTRIPEALSTAFLTASGWVLNEHDEPLVFIPAADRESIQPLHGTAILGSSKPMVRLDFSKFKYGDDWEQCFTPAAQAEAAT